MLNEKACAVYDYIRQQTEHGIPPTVREIGAALEMRSTSTVHRYVQLLVEEGYLEKIGNQNRALRLTGQQTRKVPLLASLTAESLLAMENIRRYVSFDDDTPEPRQLFAWQLPAGEQPAPELYTGDVLILEQTQTVPPQARVLTLQAGAAVLCFAAEADTKNIYGRLVAVIHYEP